MALKHLKTGYVVEFKIWKKHGRIMYTGWLTDHRGIPTGYHYTSASQAEVCEKLGKEAEFLTGVDA